MSSDKTVIFTEKEREENEGIFEKEEYCLFGKTIWN